MSEKSASFRSELSKVRFFGAAHDGTGHAWATRVSAAALALLTFPFVFLIICLSEKDYFSAVAVFRGHVAPSAIAALFLLAALYHMKLGMQVIIEDYVHASRLKMAALLGNIFFCGALAVCAALAIVKLYVGA